MTEIRLHIEKSVACIDLPKEIDVARITIRSKRVELTFQSHDLQVNVADSSGVPISVTKESRKKHT